MPEVCTDSFSKWLKVLLSKGSILIHQALSSDDGYRNVTQNIAERNGNMSAIPKYQI
jgi:hypothetical protein